MGQNVNQQNQSLQGMANSSASQAQSQALQSQGSEKESLQTI